MRQQLFAIFYILASGFWLLPAPKTLAGKPTLKALAGKSSVLCLLFSVFGLLPSASASPLPTFNDFGRVDRERRASGQLQTAESLGLMRVDPALILRIAEQYSDDPQIQWGAAELLTDWTQKQAQFETALAVSGTNTDIALRFGFAAMNSKQPDLALDWICYCQEQDPTNVLPWIGELWILHQKGGAIDAYQPPATATQYHDYGVGAARARIRLLEAAGYSPYAARRIGFVPDMSALQVMQQLFRLKLPGSISPLLMATAQSMQHGKYLITELVGQSLEKALLTAQTDASTNTEVTTARLEQLVARRTQMKQLVTDLGRTIVDNATEPEMVQYYDDALNFGEEEGMKRLAMTVRKRPAFVP
ncbi:MAG: hypothetical protein ABSC38_04545 [Verrucomicrobiia bacterium]